MTAEDVDFGVMLSPFGQFASPETFRELATTAEEKGFDVIWTGDHILFPKEVPDEYPFSPSGDAPMAQDVTNDAYDTFLVLSMLSEVTEDIRLGTNVCVVPYRNPVVLTKLALTLDNISEGRFEFGVGTGWMGSEFDLLGIPFGERGSRTDEFLEILHRAMEEPIFDFEGPHHSFDRAGFYPRPVEDSIPVWVGGYSGAAFRRLAEYGDGWSMYGARPPKIESALDRIAVAWNDYDRDGTPDITAGRSVYIGDDHDLDTNRPLIGPAEKVTKDVQAYIDAGATEVFIDFFSAAPDDQIAQVERFGEEVISQF